MFLARQEAASFFFTISQPNVFYFKREAIPWRCVADVTCMQECDNVGILGFALLQKYLIN